MSYSHWQTYYSKRLDWAYNAKDKFIASIENEIFKEIFNSNSDKNINIAVYGHSQVGKTTLILKLIGIRNEHFDFISSILRADIPKGQSVTSTSIIYIKSSDDNFYYTEEHIEHKVTADELKQKLKDLRKKVEKNIKINSINNLQSNILIKIPNKFFNQKSKQNINIIDLPGIGSSNVKEHQHVESVIKQIIPISNLVLIIGRKLTDLQNIDIPYINNWKYNTDRFRFILTHSVSYNSVKNEFKKHLITDKTTYLSHFKKEFNNPMHETQLYPLEYGESWANLEPEIKQKAESIISELFDDLLLVISNSTSEYNQLMLNAKHWKLIEKMIETEMQKYEDEVWNIDTKLNDLKIHNINLDKNSENSKTQKERLQDSKISNPYYSFNYTLKSFNGHITRDNLIYFINNFIHNICLFAEQDLKKLNSKYPTINIPNFLNFREICNTNSTTLLNKLNGYFWNKYFLTSSQEEDSNESETVCKNIYNQIKYRIESTFEKYVTDYNTKIENEIKDIDIHINSSKYKISDNLKRIKKEEDNLLKKTNDKSEFELKSSDDLAIAKKFKDFIKQGYLQEKSDIVHLINDINNSGETKLFNFLFLYLISEEIEKLENQPV